MKGSKVRILGHFIEHGTLTSMEAFQLYGITRLAARISELREKGYDIRTVMVESTNRYGETVRFANYVYRGKTEDGSKNTCD